MAKSKDPDWGPWKVPLDGSEAAAIRSVEKQMKADGLAPNHAGVRDIVRKARKSAENGE